MHGARDAHVPTIIGMGYSVTQRLAVLQRDLSTFEQRVERVASDLPDAPSGVPAAVNSLYDAADKLRDRSMSIARQMGRPQFFDQPLQDADRAVALILDAAHSAHRLVATKTGMGSVTHAAVTVSSREVGSAETAAQWVRYVGDADLPNVRLHGASASVDLQRVIDRLENVPQAAIEATDRLGARTTLFSGKLTDVHGYRSLRGRHPRGWPPGATWDSVPGAGGERGAAVRVASEERGSGHGSTSLVLHEYGHVVDHAFAPWNMRSASSTTEFLDGPWRQMRTRSAPTPYLREHPEEWFAEAFARYTKSPQSAASLARWYPETWAWFGQHLGVQQFDR